MIENNQFALHHWGPCLMETSITQDQIESVKKLCIKDKKKDYRHELAGHLDEEFKIDFVKFGEIVKESINGYKKASEIWYGDKQFHKTLKVVNAWVNYMKPGDFNPPHIHLRCDLSGVVFLDVPEELMLESKKSLSNGTSPGELEFFINSHTEGFINQKKFFPHEGQMFIFPRNLIHFVNPFKSNCVRVSVAFNLSFINEEKNDTRKQKVDLEKDGE